MEDDRQDANRDDAGPDETRPIDRTAPLPPAEPDDGAGAKHWTGRAEVPAWEPAPEPEWTTEYDEERGRRWWLPIVLGVLALAALLGFVAWLISSSDQDGGAPILPSPSPSTSAPATPARTASTPASPTAGPSTPSPSATPAVRVPPVIGLPGAEARAALDDVGLRYRLRYRASDQPQGTVIGVDPAAGSEVPPGTVVTLTIAIPPQAPPSPGESPTGPPTP